MVAISSVCTGASTKGAGELNLLLIVHAGGKGGRGKDKPVEFNLFDSSELAEEEDAAEAAPKKPKRGDDDEAPGALHGGTEDEDDDIDPGCPNVQSRDLNEADNAVRKHYRIKASGYDPPPPLRSFKQLVSKLGAPSGLLRNLQQGGFEEPTPIQRQAIPILLAGRELLAVAPTGSGKTLVSGAASFALPLPPLTALPRLLLLVYLPTYWYHWYHIYHFLFLFTPFRIHRPSCCPSSAPCVQFVRPATGRLQSRPSSSAQPMSWRRNRYLYVLQPLLPPPPCWKSSLTCLPPCCLQARCLKLLLPGSGLRGSLLTKSTAAGTDFGKVDVLLANPLRLLSMIEAKKIDLSQVCEAGRM